MDILWIWEPSIFTVWYRLLFATDPHRQTQTFYHANKSKGKPQVLRRDRVLLYARWFLRNVPFYFSFGVFEVYQQADFIARRF